MVQYHTPGWRGGWVDGEGLPYNYSHTIEPVERFRMSGHAALNYTDALFDTARRANRRGERVAVGFKMRTAQIAARPRQWAALVRRHRTRVIASPLLSSPRAC